MLSNIEEKALNDNTLDIVSEMEEDMTVFLCQTAQSLFCDAWDLDSFLQERFGTKFLGQTEDIQKYRLKAFRDFQNKRLAAALELLEDANIDYTELNAEELGTLLISDRLWGKIIVISEDFTITKGEMLTDFILKNDFGRLNQFSFAFYELRQNCIR